MLLPLQQRHERIGIKASEGAVIDSPRAGRIAQPIAGERRQQLADLAAEFGFAFLQVLPGIKQSYHFDASIPITYHSTGFHFLAVEAVAPNPFVPTFSPTSLI